MSKPFKMKGSPFQRNFGIGNSEAPDAPSPLNAGWLGKALSAGMATLPGGYDANKQKEEAGVEYERGEDGKLILDKDGKPIQKELEESKTEEKSKGASIIEKIIGRFSKKPEETEE
tara:strand:- start:655 stop:1002 length:348 start_codon:yes stop_codon:yes gene_type:complete